MKNTLLYFILLTTAVFAQQLVVKTNGETKSIPTNTSVSGSLISNNNFISQPASNNESVRLIVELRTPSRIQQKLRGKSFSKASATMAKQQIITISNETLIETEFEDVFNGFVVTTQRENINKITSLREVKNVSYDVIVNSMPEQTTVASPIVPQHSTAATGKNIKIGVIDTGIDYLHEAFGGGFGTNFTVVGGYDFVNNDSDPMDDNGHGTHVAGIIAGRSSTINGIASDAKIYAYKALDKNGSGTASSVIAAIERALQDSIDILNLSLGSPNGSANDPLTIAVNNAVESGMIVVVAAGNTGDFGTINSPGVAKFALTVGAASNNSVASFSAKGPVTEAYQIKPDVVAPGVGILSAKNGGGYVQMSGTSMATPFVTAFAAAMKEIHPEWSATQIKDAIISNSRTINQSLFAQGHGFVNDQIFQKNIFTSPAQLSFGFNPPTEASWNQREKITVYNNSDSKKNFRVVSQSTNPAITFSFSPENLSVESRSHGEIAIDLTANNLFLANNSEFANGYTGDLLLVSETDTQRVPFAFFKGTVMQLSFNEVPWMVMIHNQKNFSKIITPKTNQISLVVKDDVYDIVTSFYGSRYSIKENNVVNGKSEIDINSSDASFPLTFSAIDERGDVLRTDTINGTYSYLEGIVHRSTGFAIVSLGGGKTNAHINRPKYFSTMSNNYSFGSSLNIQAGNALSFSYDVIVDSGMMSPKAISFLAADVKSVDVKFAMENSPQRIFPITWTSYIGKASSVSVTFYDGKTEPLRFPFIQKAFYIQRTTAFPIFHQREAYNF